MKKKPKKTAVLYVRCTPAEMRQYLKHAELQERSLASWVRWVLNMSARYS